MKLNLCSIVFCFCIASLFSFTSFAGDKAGNGGDIYLDPMIEAEALKEAVLQSRSPIEFLLSAKERKFVRGEMTSDSPYFVLFSAKEDVFSLLAKIKINIEMSRSCVDSNGYDEDGAASINGDNTICISIKRLQSKLINDSQNPDDYRSYIGALVLHEISHLMGANENQARALQMAAWRELRWLSKTCFDRDLGNMTCLNQWIKNQSTAIAMSLSFLKKLMDDVKLGIANPSYGFTSRWVSSFRLYIHQSIHGNDLDGIPFPALLGIDNGVSLLREKDRQHFEQYPYLTDVIADYFADYSLSSLLEIGFAGYKTVESYRYYERSRNPSSYNKEKYDRHFSKVFSFETIWIKKPQSLIDILSQLVDLEIGLEILQEKIQRRSKLEFIAN